MKNVWVIAVIALLAACHERKQQVEPTLCSPVDSIIIQHKVSDFPRCIYFGENKDTLPDIYFLDAKLDSIYKIDSRKREVAIAGVPKEIAGDDFYFMVNNDTPLFASSAHNRIVRYDGSAIDLGTKNYDHQYLFSTSVFNPADSTVVAYKIPNLRIYVDSERKRFFEQKIMSLIKLGVGNSYTEQVFLNYPWQYRGQKLFFDFYPSYVRVKDSLIYYLFHCSDSLGCYNLRSHRLSSIPVGGYTGCKMKAEDLDSIQHLSYAQHKALKSEMIGLLLYDASTQKLLIVKSLPLDQSAAGDGLYQPTFKDKKLLFMVIDHNQVQKVYQPKNYQSVWSYRSFFWRDKLYVWNYAHTKIYIYNM